MTEGAAEGQETVVISSRFSSRKAPQMGAKSKFPGFPESFVKSDRLLAAGMTNKEIIDEYPELSSQDIRGALAYATNQDRGLITPTA